MLAVTGCPGDWQRWWPGDGDDDGEHGAAGSGIAGSGSAGSSGAGSSDRACGSRGLAECPEGQFCEFPETASCGEADAPGVCAEIPQNCTAIYAPVCGCDDQTYGNDCEAKTAGVSVRTSGECAEEQACGGLQGLQCDDGEYCNYPEDAQCGRADATGVCAAIPEVCTLELNPVCGCNSRTYSNWCAAAAAGVSVESEGECADEYCGGYAGIKCSEDEYCDFAAGQGCDVADGSGVCRPRPRVCTREYQPVCGCNDWTYDNACLAASDGMSVRAPGDCGPVQ
jgi:hypothetical protein